MTTHAFGIRAASSPRAPEKVPGTREELLGGHAHSPRVGMPIASTGDCHPQRHNIICAFPMWLVRRVTCTFSEHSWAPPCSSLAAGARQALDRQRRTLQLPL